MSTVSSAIVASGFRFTVDYNLSILEMAASVGIRNAEGILTPKNFPLTHSGKVEFEGHLIAPDPFLWDDEAKMILEDDGWEISRAEHLLSFSGACPKMPRAMRIVALGARYLSGNWTRYLTLMEGNPRRSLGGYSIVNANFNTDFAFLGVRRIP
jgi:hypothetical protein